MEKPLLLVQETPLEVRTTWGESELVSPLSKRKTNLWTHNEVTIAYHRSRNLRSTNYETVTNAIMNALVDAHIPLTSLRYQKRTPCRRKRKNDPREHIDKLI